MCRRGVRQSERTLFFELLKELRIGRGGKKDHGQPKDPAYLVGGSYAVLLAHHRDVYKNTGGRRLYTAVYCCFFRVRRTADGIAQTGENVFQVMGDKGLVRNNKDKPIVDSPSLSLPVLQEGV
jgi:hypothetical protein